MTAALTELYRSMLLIRRVEERIAEEYTQQEMRCPVHFCIGQEAIAAGVCAALSPDDKVMSGHRSHGHYLAKGGNLARMIAELYGKATGCCSGKGGSMHLIDLECGFLGAAPIVGSTIPIAVGTAFAAHSRKEARITAVFFGDAAVESGAFYESANFALVHNLPVLFVCEDNLYSVYTPMAPRQPNERGLSELAAGIGLKTEKADGNDVTIVEKYAVQAAIDIRAGGGPWFLEFSTYRWLEHCGPQYDNDLGYRTQAEFEAWQAQCPVSRARTQLLKNSSIEEGALNAIEHELSTMIDDAFSKAKAAPFPAPEEALKQIYAA